MTYFHNPSLMVRVDGTKAIVFFPQEFLEFNAYRQWAREGRPEGRHLEHYSKAEQTFQNHFRRWYSHFFPENEIIQIIPLPTETYVAFDKAKYKGIKITI